MNASESFRKHINELVDSGKVTKKELSEGAGISRSSLDGYLKGDNVPGIDQVQRFADFLGFKVSAFFSSEKLPPRVAVPSHEDQKRLKAIRLLLSASDDDIEAVLLVFEGIDRALAPRTTTDKKRKPSAG